MRKLAHFAIALPLLFAFACGGTQPQENESMDLAGQSSGDGGGNQALFTACTNNSDCASGLCTKNSYDRAPGPICTYACDANDMNPLCPIGCNPKGYCKMGM